LVRVRCADGLKPILTDVRIEAGNAAEQRTTETFGGVKHGSDEKTSAQLFSLLQEAGVGEAEIIVVPENDVIQNSNA